MATTRTSSKAAEPAKEEEEVQEAETEPQEPAFDVTTLSVTRAWNLVLGGMPAIGKAKQSPNDRQQGDRGVPYAFRSIEQFTAHASLLFAKYGVTVFPRVREISYTEVGKTQGGSPIIEARGIWDWDIYGPQGDSITASSAGQGRDTSDKSANKAATAAFKYLLMPALMISDKKDDPDHQRIEPDGAAPEPPPSPEEQAKTNEVEEIFHLATELKNADKSGEFMEALRGHAGGGKVNDIRRWIAADPAAARSAIQGWLDEANAEASDANADG